ncbi:nicotinate (nicotinamide) nucleotide adenylyltransferase [Nodularia spumigena CS-584]|jgi:nicotinate-nucleotide adenylyltransferase|uniref:Probable nicotinate-nucleotide adenylyltransferase n=1 Tax=Nodularia spumigena UHCC 0060 TaxID=3110300 RepID=A0ABU5UU33_NODSP|nr:nicotinate (nicotinamide) nucleotide adenylyltransferase [Nodularia spumigena]AHJ31017.1 Nicotinate-nucleotide adenylyltransferase bacterial NadD family [Nodularia spumigena CCY9414]EAW44695.1 nicotinate-nucleotide adenylyltransferase [Nodularia spumigena CCY9414]MDB9303093.1 nicotinate (nicotinamide) nucleotide adenylyltransferase [Nodularia spumigena CS-591/12]MDB9382274.1 nicotinate (nicotinamide) nucleotide adenylyltransferase [Nodularia spumigena CS-584]MEA5527562.1 nicotinate (nicotin
MRHIGIFGGTFDPIHWGHLLVAQTALSQVPLEKVIWVPSLNPPHKKAVMFEHRGEMLKLATSENPAFTVSLIEAKRSGTSYAINTLMDLSSCYANTHWYSIVGLDTFKTLPRWYRGQELAQMCDWLIAPRLLGGETIAQSELICKQVEQQFREQLLTIDWQLLNIPLVGISSSLVRKFCRDRQSIRYLVPESVRSYITTHSLYSDKSE